MIDIFDSYPVISNAIHVTVDLAHSNGDIGFDASAGYTVCSIIQDYLNIISFRTILIFICDSKDQKQLKRSLKFQRWFQCYGAASFEKCDQEILEPDDSGNYVTTFISLMFCKGHPKKDAIMIEMDRMKDEFGLDKPVD